MGEGSSYARRPLRWRAPRIARRPRQGTDAGERRRDARAHPLRARHDPTRPTVRRRALSGPSPRWISEDDSLRASRPPQFEARRRALRAYVSEIIRDAGSSRRVAGERGDDELELRFARVPESFGTRTCVQPVEARHDQRIGRRRRRQPKRGRPCDPRRPQSDRGTVGGTSSEARDGRRLRAIDDRGSPVTPESRVRQRWRRRKSRRGRANPYRAGARRTSDRSVARDPDGPSLRGGARRERSRRCLGGSSPSDDAWPLLGLGQTPSLS